MVGYGGGVPCAGVLQVHILCAVTCLVDSRMQCGDVM